MRIKRIPKHQKKDEEDHPGQHDYRPFSLYGMLICGLLIFFIGVYLTVENTTAAGKGFTSRHNPDGHAQYITGPGAIVIGLGIAVVPAYFLLKYSKKK